MITLAGFEVMARSISVFVVICNFIITFVKQCSARTWLTCFVNVLLSSDMSMLKSQRRNIFEPVEAVE